MKKSQMFIKVLSILTALVLLCSCGKLSSDDTKDNSSVTSDKAKDQKEEPIQINLSNFSEYFNIEYEFDKSSLLLPEGKWKKMEGSNKLDYKDDYYAFVKNNYDDVIKANLVISIKPKIPCSVNNVTINGVPRNKNSNAPLKLSSGWQNKSAYYNSDIYYNDSDIILERCTPIAIKVNSNYEETTKTVIQYTTSAKEFDYDYFDMIPTLYITEISGSIIPLNVDNSKYKQVTVNSTNFYDYFDIDYTFERPMLCFESDLADLYWYDAFCIMTINVKPKSDKIVSFDGLVSVRYERADLDSDNTYFTRDILYKATFNINNGKLTSTNAKNLKIPKLSYVEFDKNDYIISTTKLNGSALQNFANKYSKIKITAILPETSIDVLVKN